MYSINLWAQTLLVPLLLAEVNIQQKAFYKEEKSPVKPQK